MSRETLLDEAIAKAKEAEDWQLVEWLRMARGGESAAKWYTEKLRDADQTVRKLLDENAKLWRLVQDLWSELHAEEGSAQRRMSIADRMRELGVEARQ